MKFDLKVTVVWLVAAISGGVLGGFFGVSIAIWPDGLPKLLSENWWDGMTAFGTVGAVIVASFSFFIQSRRDSEKSKRLSLYFKRTVVGDIAANWNGLISLHEASMHYCLEDLIDFFNENVNGICFDSLGSGRELISNLDSNDVLYVSTIVGYLQIITNAGLKIRGKKPEELKKVDIDRIRNATNHLFSLFKAVPWIFEATSSLYSDQSGDKVS